MHLPVTSNREEIVQRCVQDFRERENGVIAFKKTLRAADGAISFLVFDLANKLDGPSIVYAVDNGQIKFKFTCACGRGS
jgi:hypothetical protein